MIRKMVFAAAALMLSAGTLTATVGALPFNAGAQIA
jgi:hypothetical protein